MWTVQIRQCEVCNKSMAVTSLKRHRNTVHKENIGKQILCPDCGKHFQSKSRLIAEDAHEILSCTDSADCKYKTTSKAYLRDHKRRMHIASAIPGQWMCFVEAPRYFLNHHQHQKHQQDHANVKCPECNKSFAADRNTAHET